MGISEKLITVAENAKSMNILYDSQVGKNVVAYQYDEIISVINKIKAFKSTTPNSVVFGIITDTHLGLDGTTYQTKTKRAIDAAAFALDRIASFTDADFIANLGDNNKANNIDTDSSYQDAEYMRDIISAPFKNHTSFRLVGNHDQSNSCPDTVYELNGKYNVFDNSGDNILRGYGYKDFESKKLRVICLNTCDYYHGTGGYDMSYSQKQWLMQSLDLSSKSNADEWSIIILSHFPLDYQTVSSYNTVEDVQSILNAYVNGTTVSITVNQAYAQYENETVGNSISYNYSGKNQAKIIGNFHGHIHSDAYGKMETNDITRVCSNLACGAAQQRGTITVGDITYTATGSYEKVQNTASETSVTFYVVDIDRNVIHSVQYGAGIDREIPYGEAVVYSVTNTLTNVSTSNNATAAAEGTPYVATITADSDCVLSAYSVTMGGVDVTDSYATVQNNVVSISIPSVAGDISVTVIASTEQYSYAVPDVKIAVRMDWSGNAPVSAANSNPDAIFGVSTANAFSFTDRSSNTFYAMPIPPKATKVTINTSDNTLPSLSYRYRLCKNIDGTLTKQIDSGSVDNNSFSFTKGAYDYICIMLRRSDSTSWSWDYSPSNFDITFSNY